MLDSKNRPQIVGIIPARWQSSRFPGKPLADILGKSLIQRTYERAQKSTLLNDLIVTTDDERILTHVHNFGGKAIMTGQECQNGTERVALAAKDSQADIILNIQGDEPLLSPKLLETLIQKMLENKESVITTAMTKITDLHDLADPSVVKVVFDKQGKALYFSRSAIPFAQKEQKYAYYRHIGVYCFRRDFLMHYQKMAPTNLQSTEDLEQLKILENGFPIHLCEVDEPSIGVDTPEDLKKVERILCHHANTSSLQAELSPR